MRMIPDFLSHGAEAYGSRGDVCTRRRITEVIKRDFGVSYSKSQVSRLLKKLGWNPQVPSTRAIQRDEEAIEYWRIEVWPDLKARTRRDHRRLIFVGESDFYLLPGVVKTYAPKGVTRIIYEWQTRDHLSVMGGVTPSGKVYTLVRQESLNGLHTVGKKLLVISDGSPIHRREEVKEFLVSPEPETSIHVEALPPYATDLNPSEGAWRWLKLIEMRNMVCLDLKELHMVLHLAIGRLRRKPQVIRSFFAQAGLLL